MGYRTFEAEDIGCLELGPQDLKTFFAPNRTLLIDITLTREQKDHLFALKRSDTVNRNE